ncbi:MAG: hypothetical protein K0V04_35595 [Deltaproteobacteria bacterium]|nr:hypothetical protein [Deltaproteobacteria bacterium]
MIPSTSLQALVDDRSRALRLPRGGLHPAQRILSGSGLPRPWPHVAQVFVAISNELEGRIQCDDVTPLETQWNAMCGVWLLKASIARDPTDLPPNRKLPGMMRNAARVLYGVVHETAHLMVAELALQGLWRTSPDPVEVHVLGELFAEYVSHYELGACTRGYWRRHWRPIVEGSEAQDCNAGLAAIRAGARTRVARAELAISSYYEGLPPRVDVAGSPELLAVWTAHRMYATKTWDVCRRWQTLHWDDPALQQFIERFVPPTPAPLWLRGRTRPLEVRSARDVLALLPVLAWDWIPPPRAQRRRRRARRRVQRAALLVAQLRRLVSSERAALAHRPRARALRVLDAATEHLYAAYQGGNATGPHAVIDGVVEQLLHGCGPHVRVEHPALSDTEMTETPLLPSVRAGTRWPTSARRRSALRKTLAGRLDTAMEAASTVCTHVPGAMPPRYLHRLHRLDHQLEALGARGADPRVAQSIVRDVEQGLAEVATTQRAAIDRIYRWEWARTRPFMDPLAGFFIR